MASFHIEQLKYALGLSGLFTFYGMVTMIIWFSGEYLQYSPNYRIVIIAMVLVTMPFALAFSYISSRRKAKQEQAEKEAAEKGEGAAQSATTGEPQKLAAAKPDDELSKGAEEVAQFLKSSNLDVYSLPWYLVVGTHKAGKTSLILGSELNFQTLPSQRQSEQKFIRPTRGVEWRVTSDAVFIDTAGRFQSESEADAQEWSSLIETIKKYRANRPLDGMIITAGTERLLHSEEREVDERAKVLRTRIDEAVQRTKIRFPIYLVFTHADAIEGFRDSFSTSQKENEKLVWGATIPLEKSENGHTLFDSEFDLLQNSVMKRRLFRLSAPFPPIRQLRIFNFPLHFGSTRRKLGAFVATLFRPNPFSESPFLRGFYFTAVPVNRPKNINPGQTMAGVPQVVGQTYFTQKLFRDVILRDKDLVATLQAQKQKPPILGWVLTALGALLLTLFLGLSAYSLYRNKVLLNEASANGEKLLTLYKSDAGRDIFTKNADEALVEINAIEALRKNLVEIEGYNQSYAPWMRMGLYSGDRIHGKLLQIYYNAVEQRFKKPVVKKIEDDLRKFASTQTPNEKDLDKNFDVLQAYLTLSGEENYRKRAEAGFLASALTDYWKSESKFGSGLDLVALQQLEFWTNQIKRDDFPFIKLNETLIADTRKKLNNIPPWQQYYKREAAKISKQLNEQNGDITVEGILSKNAVNSSFIKGSYRVPNVYTTEGLAKMDAAIKSADQKIGEDNWILGDQAPKAATQGTEAARIQERYYRDYTEEWRKFAKGISIESYGSPDGAKQALDEFSSTNSPLRVLMTEVARETNFSAKPKQTSWWDLSWIWQKFFGGAAKVETGGNTEVERDFRPLFTFVDGENSKQYYTKLGGVKDRLQKLTPDQLKDVEKDLQEKDPKDTRLQLTNAENDISNLLGSFKETSAGQDLANVLQKPLANLRVVLGAGATTQIEKSWEQVRDKSKDAEKGYPFDDSGTDADITKLSVYLNPADGTLSKFYEDRLPKYFEESGGQLKLREGSDVNFSGDFVGYLNNAFRLREALFGKSKTPAFNYEFKLQKVSGTIVEVTIDGQKIDSNGTGSTNFKFPATSGETGVVMSVGATDSTTSTSGISPSSANTSDNSVNSSSNTNTAVKVTKPNTETNPDSGTKKYPGTWGLFKFFADGNPKKNAATGEYVLTYKIGGKTVTATVKPTGGDLFDRNLFKSVRAPQNLLIPKQ